MKKENIQMMYRHNFFFVDSQILWGKKDTTLRIEKQKLDSDKFTVKTTLITPQSYTEQK